METQSSAQGSSYGDVPRSAPRVEGAETNRITIRRLPRATALTAVAAVAANLFTYFVASAVWAVPGDFAAFTRFTVPLDPRPMLRERDLIYVSRWANATLNRYCLRYNFAAKTEWP